MDISEIEQQTQAALQHLWDLIETVEERGESPDVKAKAEQLKAVAQSIRRLEKKNVPVPEDLRQLKLSLNMEADPEIATSRFFDMVRKEVARLNDHLSVEPKKRSGRNKHFKTNRQPITRQEEYRPHIMAALKANGGHAHCHVVFEWIEKQFKDKFLPGDLAHRRCGELVWLNNVRWQRQAMVNEGIIKRKSSHGHGVWQLQEDKP